MATFKHQGRQLTCTTMASLAGGLHRAGIAWTFRVFDGEQRNLSDALSRWRARFAGYAQAASALRRSLPGNFRAS